METTTKVDRLSDYEDAEGVARASVEYDADHAFGAVWQDGECEQAPIVRGALGCLFTEPTNSDEVNEISKQLGQMADAAREQARTCTDETRALALFRRCDELYEAAQYLRITDGERAQWSQIVGDEEYEEARQLVLAWDEINEGHSWMEDGSEERVSAFEAVENELRGSRSGFTSMEVVATRDSLSISFGGYSCDMRGINLVVRRGDEVDAVTAYLTDIDLVTLDDLCSYGSSMVLACALLDALPYYDISAGVLSEMAEALSVVKEVRDMDRITHTVQVLGDEWTGDVVELVRAAVTLTLSA